MKRLFANGVIIFAGVVTTPPPAAGPEVAQLIDNQQHDEGLDPRLQALREYFQLGDCPAEAYSEEFLRAADTYNLDWRLLPSLSMVETSGGKCARNNNWFGWNNGRASFPSAPHAIRYVASSLAESKPYKDKDLEGKLTTYNPVVQNYSVLVKSVMTNIGRRVKPHGALRTSRPLRPPAF